MSSWGARGMTRAEAAVASSAPSSRCRRSSCLTTFRSRGVPDGRCETDHRGYVFKGSFRITTPMGRKEYSAAGQANHLRPRHFVQTLEPFAVMEISPVEQHDRAIATIASNIGLVAS